MGVPRASRARNPEGPGSESDNDDECVKSSPAITPLAHHMYLAAIDKRLLNVIDK